MRRIGLIACTLLVLAACGGGGGGSDNDLADRIPRPPADPRIVSTAPTSAMPGQLYRYEIQVAGSNTPFTITSPLPLPAFLNLVDNGGGAGLLSGTPGAGDVGVFTITIRVTGGDGEFFDQTFDITVSSAPAFTSMPVTDATPGALYQYNITTSGDDVALNPRAVRITTALPGWLSFNDNGDGTASLMGTPGAGDSGTVPIGLLVEDSFGDTATQDFQITVGADNQAPVVTLVFPPAPGQTTAAQIVVRGIASDAATITQIQVNGIDATTTDGFANWQATVPLNAGANLLTVSASDDQGNSNPNSAQQGVQRIASLADPGIGSGPAFASPRDIQVQTAQNRVLVIDGGISAGADRALFAIDVTNGNRTVISDNAIADPDMFNPTGMDDDFDNNRMLVVDAADGNETLFGVDLTSGAHTVLSNALRGTGDNFQSPVDVLLLSNGLVLVSDEGVDATSSTGDRLVAVNLGSGNRAPFSGGGSGAGPLFNAPRYLTTDTSEASLFLTDINLDAVFAVAVSNGNRTVISDAATGAGPALSAPQGIDVLEGLGQLVVADSDLDQLLGIDIASGNRVTLSGGGVGGGPVLASPRGLVADATAGLALLVDDSIDAVLVVDIVTGERLIVSR